MNGDGVLTLLDLVDRNPIENPLCVMKDGKAIDMLWEELFDSTNYDELMCSTYVSSPSFFAKATKGFEKIQIIIGIEKSDVKSSFSESIRQAVFGEGTKFFEGLPEKYKDGVLNERIEIRYSKPDSLIHSKFYLLRNSKNGKKRVIFGSANLTESAMGNNIHHFEDVMLFDDNEDIFEQYYNRFMELKKNTIDYVPETAKENYKEGKFIRLADFTPEEKTKELVDNLIANNIVPVCDEKVLEQVQEVLDVDRKEREETEISLRIIEAVSKRSPKNKDKLIVKTGNELQKSKEKITDLLYKTNKNDTAISRLAMTYNDTDRHQYWVRLGEEGSEQKSELVDRKATSDEIKTSINQIVKFVDAYKLFTHNPDNTNMNLAHIYEIILYSFMSAYMFRLREDDPGNKADYPIMLVIGGRASSGKSHLLSFVDKLLSGRTIPYDKCYLQYGDIDRGSIIGDLFESSNTYPILVDEVSPKFFKSKSHRKGEDLIKYLSNTLDGKHPVMICTTNTTAFSIPRQVERRVYYIQVNDCFDASQKGMTNEYYDSLMSETSNVLYRDFCYRMSERLAAGESLVLNTGDYLSVAREVFKEYFEVAEMELPGFFPTKVFSDYESRGVDMWRILVKNNPGIFRRDKKDKNGDDVLSVNFSSLAGERETYLNYLRPDLLKEDAGAFVVIRTQGFLEWVGYDSYFKKMSVLRSLSK